MIENEKLKYQPQTNNTYLGNFLTPRYVQEGDQSPSAGSEVQRSPSPVRSPGQQNETRSHQIYVKYWVLRSSFNIDCQKINKYNIQTIYFNKLSTQGWLAVALTEPLSSMKHFELLIYTKVGQWKILPLFDCQRSPKLKENLLVTFIWPSWGGGGSTPAKQRTVHNAPS